MDFETLNAICHHSLGVVEKSAKVRSFDYKIITSDAKPFQTQVAMRTVGALPSLINQQTGYRLYIQETFCFITPGIGADKPNAVERQLVRRQQRLRQRWQQRRQLIQQLTRQLNDDS